MNLKKKAPKLFIVFFAGNEDRGRQWSCNQGEACLAADVPRHRDARRPLPKTSASSSYKSQMRDGHNRGRGGKKDETEGERTREAERKREKQKEERERKKGDNM